MGGYNDRYVLLEYPKLGDGVFVKIRNPLVAPPDTLLSDNADVRQATYEVMSRLVVDWHVWDPTSDEEDQPELPLPATPETVRLLPAMITIEITRRIREATNPQ